MAAFEQEYNDKVTLSVIGGNYPAVIETTFISGAPVDHVYALIDIASKWYAAGWLQSLDEHPDADNVKKDIYPAQLDNYLTIDGKLLGFPYYTTSLGNIETNEKLLEEAGYADTTAKTSDYPTTYDELYDQCEKIKKKGVTETPWVPRVSATFVGYYPFIGESMNRGDLLFDKEFNPTFDTDTPIKDTFAAWKYLWDHDMFPKWVLTAGENDAITAFASGKYAYSGQQTYELRFYSNPETSKIAGYASIVPVKEQPWGILVPGINVMSKRPRSKSKQERVNTFFTFKGYRDKQGVLRTAKKWAIISALNSAYKEILQDPDVQDAYREWIYREEDLKSIDSIFAKAQLPIIWKAPWAAEWMAVLNEQVPAVLQDETTIDEAISALRKAGEDMKKKYTK